MTMTTIRCLSGLGKTPRTSITLLLAPLSLPARPGAGLVLIAMLGAFSPARGQFEYVRQDYRTGIAAQFQNAFTEMARWDNGDVIRVDQMSNADDHGLNLYRTAADGSLRWAKRIASGGWIRHLNEVAALPDGTALIGGRGMTQAGFLLRVDSTGALIMARAFDLGGTTWPDAFQVRTDSTVRVAGYLNGLGGGGWMATMDMNDGNVHDAFRLTQTAFGTNWPSTTMHVLPDGNTVYIARRQLFQGSGVMICVLDTSDTVLWCNSISITDSTTLDPLGSVMLADGSIRIVCRYYESFDDPELPVVVALSPTGEPLWVEKIDFSGPNHIVTVHGIVQLSDTTFALLGNRWNGGRPAATLVMNAGGAVLGTHTLNAAKCDLREAFLEPTGEVVASGNGSITGIIGWNCGLIRFLPDAPFCGDFDLLSSVAPLTMTIGDTAAQGPLVVNSSDILADLLITDQDLDTYVPCSSTNMLEAAPDSAIIIWPNPAHDVLQVSGPAMQQLEILDAIGRLILTRSFQGSRSAGLDIGGLVPGLYHVRLRTDAGWISTKLVKE